MLSNVEVTPHAGFATILSPSAEASAIRGLHHVQPADACLPLSSYVALVDGSGVSKRKLLLRHYIAVGGVAGRTYNYVDHTQIKDVAGDICPEAWASE